MADLITLDELKTLRNIKPSDTRLDAQMEALIPMASQAVLTYTGRDFGTTPPVVQTREFEYDYSGYLDIDDATEIYTVTLKVPWGMDYVMAADEFLPRPQKADDSQVYWYILIPGMVWPGSPEMGFVRNADVAAAEGRWRGLPSTVEVSAAWGWPAIPADVKLAVHWTLDSWLSRPSGDDVLSESIESYSVSYANAGDRLALAVPNRARDILVQYAKVMV